MGQIVNFRFLKALDRDMMIKVSVYIQLDVRDLKKYICKNWTYLIPGPHQAWKLSQLKVSRNGRCAPGAL